MADSLVIEVYGLTKNFPREELFGLVSQMRRAAVSIAANIVEGCARKGLKDYVNFLNIAFGSLRELGYFIDLSHRLGYLGEPSFLSLDAKYQETARVLSGLITSLSRRKP
jgi:four helix bundle protein